MFYLEAVEFYVFFIQFYLFSLKFQEIFYFELPSHRNSLKTVMKWFSWE